MYPAIFYGGTQTTKLYVPLDIENNLKIDALVDSRTYVKAIAQNQLETKKQRAPMNILRIDDLPFFKQK